jgi:glutathione synthase/RimK-type ligase-like ATP-grasp enzyme
VKKYTLSHPIRNEVFLCLSLWKCLIISYKACFASGVSSGQQRYINAIYDTILSIEHRQRDTISNTEERTSSEEDYDVILMRRGWSCDDRIIPSRKNCIVNNWTVQENLSQKKSSTLTNRKSIIFHHNKARLRSAQETQ